LVIYRRKKHLRSSFLIRKMNNVIRIGIELEQVLGLLFIKTQIHMPPDGKRLSCDLGPIFPSQEGA
jgi:hypothetical protein